MPLPALWSDALDEAAHAALLRAEAYIAARERAGVRVYPAAHERFRALEWVAPEDVKVVILGQDPYHGCGQAMGLAFSVPRGARVPPSLRNIFKELQADLDIAPPGHGDLGAWAAQGVLLLNTVLSVEEGAPASHAKLGWECVTDRLIEHVSQSAGPAVFMLWGKHAQAKARFVDPRHLLLQSAHPSPLSARRFLGCRHFSQANAFLARHGARTVRWALAQSPERRTEPV